MYIPGYYIASESFIHRLDPRVKLLSVIAVSLLILVAGLFPGTIITLFLFAVMAMSRISPIILFKTLKPVSFFILILFLLHLLFTRGTPLPPFPNWPVTVTSEGLKKGLMVSWQFALLVLSASVLTATTSPTELVAAVEKLLRPFSSFGVPSHDIAMMVSMAFRFLPSFVQEAARIKEAHLARGSNLAELNLGAKLRAAISFSSTLVINSLRKADELATAMEARAYSRGHRTSLRKLQFTRTDYLATVMISGFVVVCVLI
jgi:energy-coupling factor transporter transmembrane protein EcfT